MTNTTNKNTPNAGHRVVLFVDDDAALMHNYHNWMSTLSTAYARFYGNGFMNRLYDRRVFDIKDLIPILGSINKSYDANLDLVITDFDLVNATGNDVARIVKARFPDVRIVGNTGGDPARFDRDLVNSAVSKIADRDTLYSVIDLNTRLRLHSGCWDLFDRAKSA